MSLRAATWNLPAPLGFQGLRDDLPLRVYEQLLPHWRQTGATYFVTFRLSDSLPQQKLAELRMLKANWERQHPPPRSRSELDEIAREIFQRIDDWLDQGMGSCLLKESQSARLLIEAMHSADGCDHELGCYVIMPNHVHAIVRPLISSESDLEDVLRIWKGRSAYEINRLRGDGGTLWQRESYDRIIRDEVHLWRVIQYIGRNPRNAGLDLANTPLWIRPAWVECGWQFSENTR